MSHSRAEKRSAFRQMLPHSGARAKALRTIRRITAYGLIRPCMIKIILILVEVTSRIRVSLGKPFRPEDRHHRLSLCVDWLPALFADTAEYPRLRACIRKDGRRLCRVREPVLIVAQLSLTDIFHLNPKRQ